MELIRFGVDKFRLFKKQVWINLNGQTILIGPNNEGKSTVCDALSMFFSAQIVRRRTSGRVQRTRRQTERLRYVLERDYPIGITSGRRWPTKFTAIFKISPHDQKNLPASIQQEKEITVVRQWNYEDEDFEDSVSKTKDPTEVEDILDYINDHVKLITIPAIREESNLGTILQQTFDQCIHARTEHSRKIKSLKSELTKLLEPEINKTRQLLNETLASFLKLPIKLEFEWDIDIANSINLNEIKLDDGNLTNISLKGDGLKSIIQMALLAQYSDIDQERTKTNIYIIEEPESHLNSSFLYNIKEQLVNLSKHAKVLVTTHSPVFVDLCDFSSNYLVQDGSIKLPKSKNDIATALGIRLQENLKSNFGLLCLEGYDDVIAVESLLRSKNCLDSVKGNFDITSADGASKIPYVLSTNLPNYKRQVVILDNDKAGHDAHADIQNISKDVIIFVTPLYGDSRESELEDLVDLDCMAQIYSNHFNRTIDLATLQSVRKQFKGKWSNWILKLFNNIGLPMSDTLLLKTALWNSSDKIKFNKEGVIFLNSVISTLSRQAGTV